MPANKHPISSAVLKHLYLFIFLSTFNMGTVGIMLEIFVILLSSVFKYTL